MQWVLEHIQIIIVVAAIIASWLTNLRKKDGDGAGGPPPERPFMDEGDAAPADADDLTRRIQEEIRRKIAERRGEAPAPAPAPFQQEQSSPLREEPPPELRPAPALAEAAPPRPGEIGWDARQRQLRAELRQQAAERAAPPPLPSEHEAGEVEATLARQRALAERLAVLEQARQQTRAPAAVAATGESAAAIGASDLRHELRDPRALRRAFVLREILGPPVALR